MPAADWRLEWRDCTLSPPTHVEGALADYLLPDGSIVAVLPLTLGRVQIATGPGPGQAWWGTWRRMWDYADWQTGAAAFLIWNPTADLAPRGWTRAHVDGQPMRRRGADGREYVDEGLS